jgi:hypothetical protein
MSTPRKFDFPISTLIRDSKRLHGAFVDAAPGHFREPTEKLAGQIVIELVSNHP